jgi:hypothetical protein
MSITVTKSMLEKMSEEMRAKLLELAAAEKPKRTRIWTEAQKQKAKSTREAKKAAKVLAGLAAGGEAKPAEPAAEPAAEKPKRTRVWTEEQKQKAAATRAAKKAAAGGEAEAKPADDAEPKKRAPNEWILFTKRVEALIRQKETADGVGKEAKMKTVVAKQFASHLKSQKAYAEWTDEDIVSALVGWAPPAVSKQAAKKAAGSAAASEASQSDAEASEGEEEYDP